MSWYRSRHGVSFTLAVALALVFSWAQTAAAAPPLSGAIFTTNSTCTGVNVNIYPSKAAVYLDGGPAHTGAAGLPDGVYYVRVTEPDGTLLGTSVGSGNSTPVQVTGGEFAVCYQLSAILIKASDGTPGYDTTSNPGGEYKVWVSRVSTFANNETKTDNFKVKSDDACTEGCQEDLTGSILACKFYDNNTNGVDNGAGEVGIGSWPMTVTLTADGSLVQSGNTVLGGNGRACVLFEGLAPDVYTVTEGTPNEANWVHTSNPVLPNTQVEEGATTDVDFGNVCLGAGGGKTLGFWSNKNGEAAMKDGGSVNPELAMLFALNLRNASGANFDPGPGTYAAFRTWILSATATNMAYMLSAQLAAMELNVEAGFVSGGAFVYAPGTPCANAAGFCTVNALRSDANAALGACGTPCLVLDGNPSRAVFEAMKNALDKGNNNLNFVQPGPCAASFPIPE